MSHALVFSKLKKEERDELSSFLVSAFAGDFSLDQTRADVNLALDNHFFSYHFFIGRENGQIACAGALKHEGLGNDVWGIAWVSVAPDKQNKGYGRMMVDFLLDYFGRNLLKAEQGTIILTSKEKNFSFYEKLAFNPVAIHGGKRLYHKMVNRAAT